MLPLLFLLGSPVGIPHAAIDDYPRNPRIDIVNYRFAITVSDGDDIIHGAATIDARYLTGGDSLLRLDLIQAGGAPAVGGMTVESVTSGGELLTFRHQNDQLFIQLLRPTTRGEFVSVTVNYHGHPRAALRFGPNRHGDRTIFSDNWPNRARNWLPTVDHPYDKATSEMVVTAPAHYQVVSNGLMVETRDLGDGTRLTHWKQSVPIATWLYVLGVAEFAVQHRPECVGVSVQTWVARQDRDAGFHDFAEPTCDVLEFFSRQIGPYSYEKLANIVSPSVGGGMEAASAILYGEPSVSGNRALNWQNVIVHEIAHQWFGNAVTESDWDDVWLSEGFATYFTLLYREHARGRDDFVAGLQDSRDKIRAFYEDNPDYRVVHENLSDMSKVTNGMTYQKGAWILHMLRQKMGTAAFWDGIRKYYATYRNGNATTSDFFNVMSEVSRVPLEQFSSQWLYHGGIPHLELTWHNDPRSGDVVVKARQSGDAGGQQFEVDLVVEAVDSEGKSTRAMFAIGPSSSNGTRIKVPSNTVRLIVDPDTQLLADWTVRKVN